MTEYLKGLALIVVVWTVSPLLEVVTTPIEFGSMEMYSGIIREIVSTLTTIVILITVIIRYLKEKKKK